MLIIFGGLPGTGKTAIAQQLARELGAVYLRIDSMEQAIRDTGVLSKSLDDAGYRVGHAVAEDNLRLGMTVVADSVNPLRLTRDAWISVADRARAKAIEVEVTCSDPAIIVSSFAACAINRYTDIYSSTKIRGAKTGNGGLSLSSVLPQSPMNMKLSS
jgi:predicted kinase